MSTQIIGFWEERRQKFLDTLLNTWNYGLFHGFVNGEHSSIWDFFFSQKGLTFFFYLSKKIYAMGTHRKYLDKALLMNTLHIFVCVEVLRPSQPNGVMSSAVSLPNHTFTGQA